MASIVKTAIYYINYLGWIFQRFSTLHTKMVVPGKKIVAGEHHTIWLSKAKEKIC